MASAPLPCAKCGSKVKSDVQVRAEVKKIADVVPTAKIRIIVKEIKPN
jgi:hypothetical protein